MGRILALDIGERRVGMAISDAQARIAFPVGVLPADQVSGMSQGFRRVLEDHEPESIVCGLPLSLDGEEHEQAARVRETARIIGEATGLPVDFTDERLSSSAAKRALREAGLDEKRMRGKVDGVAASLFLQAYLDKRND